MNLNNQLCTARSVFPILVTVQLYTVMPEVCRYLTNEKQRKTDIRLKVGSWSRIYHKFADFIF